MDKRSILLIFLLAAALFFVQNYFFKSNDSGQQIISQQEQARIQTENEHLSENIANRTADVSKLPLVELYSDEAGQQFLTDGVLVDGNVLTLSWSEDIPTQVFFKKKGSKNTLKSALFLQKSVEVGGPLIYQNGDNQRIGIIKLPEFGTYDIQLVDLVPGDRTATIALGEYIEGYFSTPLKGPYHNSLALINTPDGYRPVGTYLSKNQTLVSLQHFLGFNDYLNVQTLHQTNKKNASREKFYVLENGYQQLVFSNYGGAITEINLPFQSEKNPKSVVKDIEFDKKIAQNYTYNSHFPDFAYHVPSDNPKGPFLETPNTSIGGYYPLLRRDLIESGYKKNVRIPPRFYALNIISDYPEVAELVYDVKYFDKHKIVFEAVQNHRKITKTFTLSDQAAPYCLDLKIDIEGDSRGLRLTSGIPETELISGSASPDMKYSVTRNQKPEFEKLSLPKQNISNHSVAPDWISNSNGFFSIIVDPLTKIGSGYKLEKIDGNIVPTRILEVDQEYAKYKASSFPGYEYQLPLLSSGASMEFRIFAGPLETGILKQIDTAYSDSSIGYSPNYVKAQTGHGWFKFISDPFAKLLFVLMKFFHTLTGSWAFSIILLTVALRIMLYPLNAWSIKSMRKMKETSPLVSEIQKRYKNEPKKAQLEIMNLYRKKKANPFVGCLPLLIQMPFLFGMFDLLRSTFSLRGASFIPGWIDNLTAPDVLFSWSNPIFFIGTEFHLLPIILGLVFFVQQKISSPLPKDKSLLTDQQKQQRLMGNIMVIVFAVMFYSFPSGLNIYWICSTLLGILQQWITNRMLDKKKKRETIVLEETRSSKKKRKAKPAT